MSRHDDPKPHAMPKNRTPAEPRKRFRIQRLEERIAPKKGGNTNHCSGSSNTISSSNYY
jgi:hypothetical protein